MTEATVKPVEVKQVTKEQVLEVIRYLVTEGFYNTKIGEMEEKIGLLEK